MNFGTYGIRPTHKKANFPNFHEFSMYLPGKFISQTRVLAVFEGIFQLLCCPKSKKNHKKFGKYFFISQVTSFLLINVRNSLHRQLQLKISQFL